MQHNKAQSSRLILVVILLWIELIWRQGRWEWGPSSADSVYTIIWSESAWVYWLEPVCYVKGYVLQNFQNGRIFEPNVLCAVSIYRTSRLKYTWQTWVSIKKILFILSTTIVKWLFQNYVLPLLNTPRSNKGKQKHDEIFQNDVHCTDVDTEQTVQTVVWIFTRRTEICGNFVFFRKQRISLQNVSRNMKTQLLMS